MSPRSRALHPASVRTPATPAALALAGLLAGLVACDRNIEPYQPGEEPRQPDLARIFPEPTGSEAAGAAATAAGESVAGARGAGAARAAFPPSRSEGAGAAAGADAAAGVAGAAPIAGRVEIAPDLADEAPGGAVLFVIARPQGATAGPPLAVVRIPEPTFPVEFEIGPDDVMIPTLQFAGPITLSARLDADGNAMTRGESDLSSVPAESVEPGATGIELVLGQKG